jgi:hypothetical protein
MLQNQTHICAPILSVPLCYKLNQTQLCHPRQQRHHFFFKNINNVHVFNLEVNDNDRRRRPTLMRCVILPPPRIQLDPCWWSLPMLEEEESEGHFSLFTYGKNCNMMTYTGIIILCWQI